MIAAETQQTTTFRGFVLYSKNSEPALAALANPIETYPMCFQYTTLVPNNVFIEQCNLHQIQTSLVNIWQKHIQNWHNAQDQKSVEPTPAANSSTIPQAAEASSSGTQPEKNGHVLQPIPEGTGMFCVKCGIYTTYMKHIRLKILKNPCKFKNLPTNKWLTKPGKHEANSRLDQEERKLQDLNKAGRDFVWNRLAGRDETKPETYGLIFCKKCERTWPWCKRHANTPRAVCRPSKASAPAPEWVKNFDKSDAVTTPSQEQPNTEVDTPEISQKPRRRMRGKTRPDTIQNCSSFAEASHVSNSTSSSGQPALPRAGIG
jgi:hypothetical protein